MIDDVAADPLAADTPRPRRAAPGGGGEAEAETAQPTGAGEPEKADGEDTETAESLSFADLLNQLEDMARHSKYSRGKPSRSKPSRSKTSSRTWQGPDTLGCCLDT